MNMQLKMVLFIAIALTGEAVCAGAGPKYADSYGTSSRNPEKNDAQTKIEQAADEFDAFALQMPVVIKDKFNAFRKRGFRAILLEDQETKPGEERMIGSLVRGLQILGDSLAEDLIPQKPIQEEEHPARKLKNGNH